MPAKQVDRSRTVHLARAWSRDHSPTGAENPNKKARLYSRAFEILVAEYGTEPASAFSRPLKNA